MFLNQAYSQDTLRRNTAWNAKWIGVNIFFDFGDYYSVNCYHKTVTLGSKPSTFRIHVSADNHYKLFVNGNMISVGPARSNRFTWKYETINIAKYLKAGANDIAAQVWNEDTYRPSYQHTVRTAFIIQGNTSTEEVMNTNNTWKCYQDKSIGPVYGYFVAVCGQRVDMSLAPPAGWNKAGFNNSAWPGAAEIFSGQLKGSLQMSNFMLVPSLMPQRELVRQNITVVKASSGMTLPNPTFPLTVAANKTVTVLLDQTYETNAFPTVKFSGGAGAGISMGYA
ncbi:alpha-rhamnosidase, partial [archaeon]